MRLSAVAAMLLALSLSDAGAIEWWHDPDRGCGTNEGWKANHRMKDLPGCSGELPKGAPPAEVLMRDAKRELLEAERLLDGNLPSKVQSLIDHATEIMNSGPKDDPRMNWSRVRYSEAVHLLGERLAALKK